MACQTRSVGFCFDFGLKWATFADFVQVEFNWYLLITAVVLGFRHGLDWDHIAAIADITGGELLTDTGKRFQLRFLELPLLYAVGHLCSVAVLALIARFIAQQLPDWVDPVMEKVVGSTLIVMGVWLAANIGSDLLNRRPVALTSRWALLLQAAARLFRRETHDHRHKQDGLRCPPPAAFGLGALHGVGAETGTQVVLLAAVSGGNAAAATGLLLSFAIGMLTASVFLGATIGAGMLTSAQRRFLTAAVGFFAAAFSIFIGACLCLGMTEGLPKISLSQLGGAIS